jgi:5-formyltetrahydrofolate cyclo-ligase
MTDATGHKPDWTRARRGVRGMTEPTDTTDAAKADFRTEMRTRLRALTEAERHAASEGACSRLCSLETFRHASVVMLYMPLATEVDVTPAAIRCFQRNQTLCVPRVDWNRGDMWAVEALSLDDNYMLTDERGLRSPRDGRPVVPGSIDLIVVPGMAFDAHGNRLGRGGGFYDRFLRRLGPHTTRVGIAFDLQVVDLVPADDRDVTMDVLITDRRMTTAATQRRG